jgi:putative SOS response-associated peptidase YedK
MFRTAFRKQRCIVLASGFYEWTGDKRDRQPHLFRGGRLIPILAFAGLWDRWQQNSEDISLVRSSCAPPRMDGDDPDVIESLITGTSSDRFLL